VCENDQCVFCSPNHPNACHADREGAACLPTHKCGCISDEDCGPHDIGRICDLVHNTCGAGCRGMSGNGCPADETCTSTTEDAGKCEPLVATPDGGTIATVGGGFCALGRSAQRGASPSLLALIGLAAIVLAGRRRRADSHESEPRA
jgi:hypothetical protein